MASALESAQAHLRSKITLEDLKAAKKKFSDGRLKDLGDEYADNYPRLGIVLSKFYGLATEYSVRAIDDFSKKLLMDAEVRDACQSWVYGHSSPELLIKLLYNLGFVGIKNDGITIKFKSSESTLAIMPTITDKSTIVIHPTYTDALSLHDALMNRISDEVELRQSGIVADLPESTTLGVYNAKLISLQSKLKALTLGDEGAADFEKIVEELLRLCFHRALTNLQLKARDVSGRVIRDIIAANYSSIPFWQMLRQQYGATQIICECKNYESCRQTTFTKSRTT